jgi:cytoskeletal protein CcmA (bactofilin family)
VGGKVEIGSEISAGNIEIGGVLRARKVLAEDRVEVGGSINTIEGTTARFVEIGKRGTVRGSIRAGQVNIDKEAYAENIFGKRILLRSGAHAENLYGESIIIESDCQISGEVQYTNELKTGDNVSLARTPQKVDKITY